MHSENEASTWPPIRGEGCEVAEVREFFFADGTPRAPAWRRWLRANPWFPGVVTAVVSTFVLRLLWP